MCVSTATDCGYHHNCSSNRSRLKPITAVIAARPGDAVADAATWEAGMVSSGEDTVIYVVVGAVSRPRLVK
jgi:hypothetical protein